jgi:hypothetical protein
VPVLASPEQAGADAKADPERAALAYVRERPDRALALRRVAGRPHELE